MDIHRTESADALVLGFSGRLDSVSAPLAEKAVEDFLSSQKSKLVLDLGGVEYMSSAGLRVLLIAYKKVASKPGRLALCGLHGAAKEVLDISNLTTTFTIAATAEEAATLLL